MTLEKGDKTYIMEPYTILNYDCMKSNGLSPKIIIGKYCSIARNVTFVLAHHDCTRITTYPSFNKMLWEHKKGNNSGYSRGDIVIGNDVWIGANCTLLDNITIGHGAVIACGSVVVKNVPDYAIVGGNPAKIIKYRFTDEQIKALLDIKWWNFHDNVLSQLDLYTTNIDKFIDSARCLIDDNNNI